jgi:NAD(P)-dependent dehydrogenase (short-subunit alcohol dehydrogenase family)
MTTDTAQSHKTAFLTGASSGIGKAAVHALTRAGYQAARQTSFARRFLPCAVFDRTLRKQFDIA